MELVCVTVDCEEPAAVGRFWTEALGWDRASSHPGGSVIVGRAGASIYLEFVPVPEPKRVKNRLHLGCSAGTLEELEAELTRLVSLGASVAWEEEFPPEIAASYRNVVLRDVEGNEFCFGGGTWPEES